MYLVFEDDAQTEIITGQECIVGLRVPVVDLMEAACDGHASVVRLWPR